MDDPARLDALARLAGIEPDYTDEWGTTRTPPPSTKIALLRAMGLAAEHSDEIEASIRQLEDAPWHRVLSRAEVFPRRRSRVPEVPVVLPADFEDETILWSFEFEMGEASQGTVRFGDLPLAAERTVGDIKLQRRALALSVEQEPGYHHLRLSVANENYDTPVIITPAACYLPAGFRGNGRIWALSVQLYGLRSERNWGVGDFGDLKRLVEATAGLGGEAVGINPLHHLFPQNPYHASPYSPSSRSFLNALYIDVPAIPGFEKYLSELDDSERNALHERVAELRGTDLVNYGRVAELKYAALEKIYRAFRREHLGEGQTGVQSDFGSAFRRFQLAGGAALQDVAVFEAIAERFPDRAHWREWPSGLADPRSNMVAEFASANADRVEFYQYLQWIAESQLEEAVKQTEDSGMTIGLFHDLALGVDPNGAEAWRQQGLYAEGASIGAPPDEWNHWGQNWGMQPINPLVLRERAFEPLIRVLHSNMRRGGALRIDHVMSLERLFWIPEGGVPGEGAYVRHPFDEYLALLALESHRERCLVVGEDLGTVPRGFRARMRRANVLSYRLLFFQRDKAGGFLPPAAYPRLSAVATGTHDLATLSGFWSGHDLDIRAELGLYPSEEIERATRSDRERQRRNLIAALKKEQLLAPEYPDEPGNLSEELIRAIYLYLARSPGRLLIVQAEDVLDVAEQSNLPGTTDEHPNWRRRLPLDVEAFDGDPRVQAMAATLNGVRPPQSRPMRPPAFRASKKAGP